MKITLSLVTVAVALAQQGNAASNSEMHEVPRALFKGKSMIQMISDGFGPASETFACSISQLQNGGDWNTQLPLDKHLVGSIRTRSADSLVTDSAASATAYSCSVKSRNSFIGVDNDQKPCGTVLEAAKAKGYNVALVTTSRVTHATPASYSAHVNDRDNENEIASQQLGATYLAAKSTSSGAVVSATSPTAPAPSAPTAATSSPRRAPPTGPSPSPAPTLTPTTRARTSSSPRSACSPPAT